MFEIPNIPGWDALHPLVVHFPLALLLSVPLFIVIGLLWKAKRECFLITALILMVPGSAAIFVAVSTGAAAAEMAERSVEMAPVLKEHSRLARTSRTIFTVLTLVYAFILSIPVLVRREMKPVLRLGILAAFTIVYLVCFLVLANTAALGGRLVHEFGVHALL